MASLPKKTEEVLTVPMQEEQKRLYMRILTDLRQQQERREAAYAEQEKAKNRALQSETTIELTVSVRRGGNGALGLRMDDNRVVSVSCWRDCPQSPICRDFAAAMPSCCRDVTAGVAVVVPRCAPRPPFACR